MEQIQTALDSISPFNAGKKREEAVALLHRFFPSMETFEAQVRKYRREIDTLEKENAVLARKAEDGKKASIGKQLEDAKLRSDYHNLRRFVDSLPDEIKRQARLPNRNQYRQR